MVRECNSEVVCWGCCWLEINEQSANVIDTNLFVQDLRIVDHKFVRSGHDWCWGICCWQGNKSHFFYQWIHDWLVVIDQNINFRVNWSWVISGTCLKSDFNLVGNCWVDGLDVGNDHFTITCSRKNLALDSCFVECLNWNGFALFRWSEFQLWTEF